MLFTYFSFVAVTAVKDAPGTDVVQKAIGTLGRWHIWVCLAIFLVKFPVAWHQLSIVFVAPPTNFSCKDAEIDKCSKNCSEHVFDRLVDTYMCIVILTTTIYYACMIIRDLEKQIKRSRKIL